MWRRQDRSWDKSVTLGIIIAMCSLTGCVTAPTYQVSGMPPSGWPPFASATLFPPTCAQPQSSGTSPTAQQAPSASAPSLKREGTVLSTPQTSLPAVVVDGNYAEFIAENEQRLQHCGQKEGGCAAALFNLGVAYTYTDSPYRDLQKAAMYFKTLLKRYPESSYALQGKVWRILILEHLALEGDLRSVQANLRSKDATIRTLQEQIQRLREQEIDMQKKERELLQLR